MADTLKDSPRARTHTDERSKDVCLRLTSTSPGKPFFDGDVTRRDRSVISPRRRKFWRRRKVSINRQRIQLIYIREQWKGPFSDAEKNLRHEKEFLIWSLFLPPARPVRLAWNPSIRSGLKVQTEDSLTFPGEVEQTFKNLITGRKKRGEKFQTPSRSDVVNPLCRGEEEEEEEIPETATGQR
ncbi:hypothetical protein RUM43_011750 [Polyplax serrata]|uniref:Uncharacterized protein n=1 Tax=Polyplax serrata TaxID=468196 RepID=A0AAN8RZF5_POLSC